MVRAERRNSQAFLSFLEANGFLPQPLRDGDAPIYRSLLYLYQYPLYLSIPGSLTCEEFVRVLARIRPRKSRHIYDAGQDSQSRSPADSRRQLFQSFATNRAGLFRLMQYTRRNRQSEELLISRAPTVHTFVNSLLRIMMMMAMRCSTAFLMYCTVCSPKKLGGGRLQETLSGREPESW